MLPEEDAAVFESRRRDWFALYNPRNGVEAAKVERSFYLWWQIGRIMRAQSASSARKPGRRKVNGWRVKRERRSSCRSSSFCRARRVAGGLRRIRTRATEGFEHPALIESRLEELEDGCRWLYVQWKEEVAILEAGKAWGAIECFKAHQADGDARPLRYRSRRGGRFPAAVRGTGRKGNRTGEGDMDAACSARCRSEVGRCCAGNWSPMMRCRSRRGSSEGIVA